MEPLLNHTGRAPEDVVLLEARQESLLKLVGELLAKNEQLRMKIAQLEEMNAAMAGEVI